MGVQPEISADGKTLVFTSLRRGGYGLGDLYISRLVNGEGPRQETSALVNTASDDITRLSPAIGKPCTSSGAVRARRFLQLPHERSISPDECGTSVSARSVRQ